MNCRDEPIRFVIRLLVRHPRMSADEITVGLGMAPSAVWPVGEPRRTPKGNPLPGVYEESKWSKSYHVSVERRLFRPAIEILNDLEQRAEFIDDLVSTGGTVEVSLDLPGGRNFGDSITPSELRRFASLQVGLGFEVFP